MSFSSTQNLNPSYNKITTSQAIVSTNTTQVEDNTQLGFFTTKIIEADTILTTGTQVTAITIPNVIAGTYIYSIDIPFSANANCVITNTTVQLNEGTNVVKVYAQTYPRTSTSAFSYQQNMTGTFQNTATQNLTVYVTATFTTAQLQILQANSYFAITRVA